MRQSLVPLLACPDCRADLILPDDADAIDGVVLRGLLTCAECARTFPVEDGILRAMPSQLMAEQVREIKARDEQVAEYEAMWYLNLFGRVEIPMTIRRISPRSTDRLLEAGCGTGRMTGRLRGLVQDVVSVDFSHESLRVNQSKLRAANAGNVDLIQADLCNLPFKDGVFDRVVSCQVLEHIPGEAARDAAVSGLSRVTRGGGRVVVSAYQHTLFSSSKQGEHDGGIPFFRFTRPEFHSLLHDHLCVESITGALVYIHLAACTKEGS